jgi:hypothetical protein
MIKDVIADHFSGNPQAGCRVTYPISRFYSHLAFPTDLCFAAAGRPFVERSSALRHQGLVLTRPVILRIDQRLDLSMAPESRPAGSSEKLRHARRNRPPTSAHHATQ